jgi:hypothetical protein
MLKPEMSLAEVFRRHEEIKEAGQAVYFKGNTADELYQIDFVEPSPNKANWYVVSLKRDDDHATSLNLPGEMIVTVK